MLPEVNSSKILCTRARTCFVIEPLLNAALSLAQVASQCGDKVGLLAYGRSVQQNIPVGRGAAHLRAIVESLAQVRGEASEADHSGAARTLLQGQQRRSLVVWITDVAETPTLPEVIEYATQITRRHLVVFSAIADTRWLFEERRTAVLVDGLLSSGSGSSGRSVKAEVCPVELRCKRFNSERSSEAC